MASVSVIADMRPPSYELKARFPAFFLAPQAVQIECGESCLLEGKLLGIPFLEFILSNNDPAFLVTQGI